MAAATAPAQQPAFGQSRWVPSLPTSLIGIFNPFATDDDSNNALEAKNSGPDGAAKQPDRKRPSLAILAQDPSTSGPPSPSRSTASVMFAEPESQITSASNSREGSFEGKKRSPRKNNRPKTSYSICHPPPASQARQKFHRRPRSLLQLHKLSAGNRPTPAFEVIPSVNFSVRLNRAIGHIFKAKHSLCPNDLVVLHAEKYYAEDQEEEQEDRDVAALICKGRKDDPAAPGRAKLCMASGEEWEAYGLPNGGYEFFSTDDHGLGMTARWVPKRNKEGNKAGPKRFKFSTIAQNSRRHPVIANLSTSGLDINDSYKMPDPAAPTPQETPNQRQSVLSEAMEEEDEAPQQEVRVTTDQLREIITISGIWVAFKEGWSPCFKYDEPNSAGLNRSASTSLRDGNAAASTPPGSPAPGIDKRGSIRSVGSNILRKSSMLSRNNRNSMISNDSSESEHAPVRSPSLQQKSRSRADSSATVLVHRAASNRRKNNQATWRPDLLSAKPELITETSREDLSRSPPNERLSAIESPAGVDSEEATPAASRRQSLAKPLIPAPQESAGTTRSAIPSEPTTPTPKSKAERVKTVEKPKIPEKKDSTSTVDLAVGDGKSSMRIKDGKRSGKWRKLFCGRL